MGCAGGVSSAPRSSAPAMELILPPRFLFSRITDLQGFKGSAGSRRDVPDQTQRVVKVLDGVVGSTWQVLRHFGPSRTNLAVHGVDEFLLFRCPFTFVDCCVTGDRRKKREDGDQLSRSRRFSCLRDELTLGIQVIMPPFPALLARTRSHVGRDENLTREARPATKEGQHLACRGRGGGEGRSEGTQASNSPTSPNHADLPETATWHPLPWSRGLAKP